MSSKTLSLLYFVAAALFLIATSINFINDGLGIMSVLGLVMAGAMVLTGMKARKAGSKENL